MLFYDKLPDMECLTGDTLPTFTIEIEGTNLNGCRMELMVSKATDPSEAVICKECEKIENGFEVTLTSDDTSKLSGETVYKIHFRFIDSSGFIYKKLCGNLVARSVPRG